MQYALEARKLVKRFGPLVANRSVDLGVRGGTVHAVMGENGAGKSTLMSMIYGMLQPDEGEIVLAGKPVQFRSASDAIVAGIGMVHQAFKLFESMTVWENVVFGAEPRRGLFIDRAASRSRVAALAKQYRLEIDPEAPISSLSMGLRQRVEILKAVHRKARILILDEPTAVLTPSEKDGLFEIIRTLKADGGTVLFVSHKLHEVMEITDDITVLRDGAVAGRLTTAETSPQEIVRAMTGRDLRPPTGRNATNIGREVLAVDGVTVGTSKPLVDAVSFSLRQGEILGIAGVAGNGQSELVQAITGMRPITTGSVRIRDQEVRELSLRERRRAGMAYIPEDRAAVGTAMQLSAAENLAAGFHRQAPIQAGGMLQLSAITDWARQLIHAFDIKISGPETRVGALSGGNLQKIVVARELSHAAPLVVVEQPTRGVDVGAMEFIHARLVEERDRGRSVLLVSSELSEILALSDRVLVMYEGRVIADMPVGEATEQKLGLLMAGRQEEAACLPQ